MDEGLLPRAFDGGRVRRLWPSDCAAFQAYRSLPDLGRYQGWTPMTDAQALDFVVEMNRAPLFAAGEWMQLGIADAASDALVGDIGLFVSGNGREGEVGFTLQPSAQGRGIATRAVATALDLLFSATGVERVLGITDDRNLPSIGLLLRLGFELVETRRVVFRDEACTERVYALARRTAGLTEDP